ncbi:MAG: Coenzyme F420 hydrogenase/dehydrogenase, beta subunit C-terminal domain [Candidatus Bathyarchaeota archaeon]|nr:Coenzyme F420 hydrogenase/dehydrogenase, beta subunit C-terminal domain [Candidatus Bathyarchaeota archaeon]MDH5713727.1 Coenzyme F420 hydrogenase/dehydrogenase, beta subunit C-terminal domain [Candidatus Bathyarchaeota archaeon]
MSKPTEKAPKLSFDEILDKVVSAEKCAGCAACVIVCPLGCLEYSEEKPKLVNKCTACGICAKVCPRYGFSRSDIEKFVFGRERKPEEDFGIHRRIVIAQASDKRILQVCQDGGVVTALLMFALENGLVDGAIVSGVDKDRPFYPAPRLATTPQEVLECAGTRYSYSANLLAFQEGIKQKKKSLAFVGTPCQIHALRKIEMVPLKKYSKPLRLAIGLMCTESFTYRGLMEKLIQRKLGINLHDISKINIKGKILVTTKSGEIKTVSLAEAKTYTRKGCPPCTDFSSELADISAGGLGLNGWTFAVIRTEKGEELFESAERKGLLRTKPVEEEKRAFGLLIKLSKMKRRASSFFT